MFYATLVKLVMNIIICVSEFFLNERIMLIGNRPHWNLILFKQLLNCEIRGLTKQLCKFINIILSTFVYVQVNDNPVLLPVIDETEIVTRSGRVVNRPVRMDL